MNHASTGRDAGFGTATAPLRATEPGRAYVRLPIEPDDPLSGRRASTSAARSRTGASATVAEQRRRHRWLGVHAGL